MRAIALATRYARALLESAADQGRMEEVGKELGTFTDLLQSEPRLRLILLSPEIDKKRKLELIQKVGEKWCSELFLRFLVVLVNANREALLPEIRLQYERLLDRRLGRVRADAITAFPLDDEVVGELGKKMSSALGAQVKLRPKVDPEILGGIVLRIDGKVYDASLRRRLERMREELLSAKLPVEQNIEVQDANKT